MKTFGRNVTGTSSSGRRHCLNQTMIFVFVLVGSSGALSIQQKFRFEISEEAAWPSGQRVGLVILRSQVRVCLGPLAGFVLGRREFKFSARLVNSQLVASCQLGFLILLCYV